jgi:cell volume regulation protein A
MLAGDITLEAVAETYGIEVPADLKSLTLADYFDVYLDRVPRIGATLPLGSIVLVARGLGGSRVNVIGLRLSEENAPIRIPRRVSAARRRILRMWKIVTGS